MSSASPQPDTPADETAAPSLADYARALRAHASAHASERAARDEIRAYDARRGAPDQVGQRAEAKALDRALDDACLATKRAHEDLVDVIRQIEASHKKPIEALVADVLLDARPAATTELSRGVVVPLELLKQTVEVAGAIRRTAVVPTRGQVAVVPGQPEIAIHVDLDRTPTTIVALGSEPGDLLDIVVERMTKRTKREG